MTAPTYDKKRFLPLYFLGCSLCIQLIGFALAFSVYRELPAGATLSFLVAFSLWSTVVFFAAGRLHLSSSWRAANVLFPWAAGLALVTPQSSGIVSVVVIVFVLLYLPTFWTRVPYYPTSNQSYERIAEILPQDREFSFVDLGCGNARLLNYLAARLPQGRYLGLEISPLAVVGATLLSALRGRGRVTIRWSNFWKVDLAPYDVVYAFLSPDPMEAVWNKVSAETRSGTLFISNTFAAPTEALREVSVDDRRRSRLYLYRT